MFSNWLIISQFIKLLLSILLKPPCVEFRLICDTIDKISFVVSELSSLIIMESYHCDSLSISKLYS